MRNCRLAGFSFSLLINPNILVLCYNSGIRDNFTTPETFASSVFNWFLRSGSYWSAFWRTEFRILHSPMVPGFAKWPCTSTQSPNTQANLTAIVGFQQFTNSKSNDLFSPLSRRAYPKLKPWWNCQTSWVLLCSWNAWSRLLRLAIPKFGSGTAMAKQQMAEDA